MVKRNRGKKDSRGFTLLEILVVLGIVVVIAVLSANMSFPVLANFACQKERENVINALERARLVAVILRRDISFEIEDTRYAIYLPGDGQQALIDNFQRNANIEVSANSEVVFHGNSPQPPNPDIEITIGQTDTECLEVVQLNRIS